jgi:predicted nucleotidyltransferase
MAEPLANLGGSIMLTLNIQLPDDKLVEFCQRWKVSELALFGSVLRDDFRPDSDIDVLITLAPDAKRGLMALAKMKYELEDLLGREVDVVNKSAVEMSHNWIRRNEILGTAQVIYVAR